MERSVELFHLRRQAATLGITVNGQNRFALITAIKEKEAEAELQELRLKATARGLSASGSKEDLVLRLKEADSPITRNDRLAYLVSGFCCLALGLAALAVSIPHVTSALNRTMGCGALLAALLAVIIDLGIACTKIVDTLTHKFRVNIVVRSAVWILMVSCLGFSAMLNGTEFMKTSDNPVLAVATAVFLSAFIFGMFYVGSSLLMRMEFKAAESANPIETFRAAGLKIESLLKLAQTLQQVP